MVVSIEDLLTAFGAGAGLALTCSFGAVMARCRGVFLTVALGAGFTSGFAAATLATAAALAGAGFLTSGCTFLAVMGLSFTGVGVATCFINTDFGLVGAEGARFGFVRELFSDSLKFGDFDMEDFFRYW